VQSVRSIACGAGRNSCFRALLLLLLSLSLTPLAWAQSAIVGSGHWEGVTYTSSCNYTMYWTLDLAYADGAYTGTETFTNRRDKDCKNIGTYTCTLGRFYSAPQDLLTPEQWQAMRQEYQNRCFDPPPTIQSVTFTSPNSLTAITLQGDGRSASTQLTRTTSSAGNPLAGTWQAVVLDGSRYFTDTITFNADGSLSASYIAINGSGGQVAAGTGRR